VAVNVFVGFEQRAVIASDPAGLYSWSAVSADGAGSSGCARSLQDATSAALGDVLWGSKGIPAGRRDGNFAPRRRAAEAIGHQLDGVKLDKAMRKNRLDD
jgi:hypothetical protein